MNSSLQLSSAQKYIWIFGHEEYLWSPGRILLTAQVKSSEKQKPTSKLNQWTTEKSTKLQKPMLNLYLKPT